MIKYLIGALALAAAGAAHAVTNAPPPAEPKVLMQHTSSGTVEKMAGSSLQVGGKPYTVTGQTRVFDNSGAASSAALLAVGQVIRFTLARDGSQQRIKELWILQ